MKTQVTPPRLFLALLPKQSLCFVLLLLLILMHPIMGFGQCSSTGGTNGGTLTPTTSFQTVSSVSGGKYYVLVVPSASVCPTYTFSFCQGGGSASFDTQITVTNTSGTAVSGAYNDDYCSTQSELVWQPSTSGTYRIFITQYSCLHTGTGATMAYRASNSLSSTNDYVLLGSATSTSSCTTITTNTTTQTGCVWDANSTLNFGASFSYDFTVNLGGSDAGADGMAFVIQNDPKGRCACGTAGGQMGAGGITKSLVVEIDTYINYEDRDDFTATFIGCSGTEEPDHLDMWVNGTVNPDLDANCAAVAAGERPVLANAIRLQNPVGTNYNIENGLDHKLRISWVPSGATGTLTARVLNAATTTTYATASTTLNPTTLFGTNTPFFGFTASTGVLTNQHSFCNPAVLLPVELVAFDAVKVQEHSMLNWTTISEFNCSHFEVLHSLDAINWVSIGSKPSQGSNGNSSSKLQYSLDHANPARTINYYRLKQVDLDGTYTYSEIRSLDYSDGSMDIKLYPNPANAEVTVSGLTPGSELLLYNAIGQLQRTASSGLEETIRLGTTDLAEGLYFLIVNSENTSAPFKLYITHYAEQD